MSNISSTECNCKNTSDYEKLVVKYFQEDSTEIIMNGAIEHAQIIIREILNNATNDVYIYSQKLAKELWDKEEIFNAVKKAQIRGVNFHVAIQENEPDQTRVLCGFNDIRSGCYPTFGYNFISADDKMFRLENDRNKYQATASANRPTNAIDLKNLFNSIIE